MKTFFTLIFLLFSSPFVFAQNTDLDSLRLQKTQLEQQIVTLKDSLQIITSRIDTLEARQQTVARPKLLSNEYLTNDNLLIRISPDTTSTVLLEVERNTPVIKIDNLQGFYLVCFDGTCGYVPEEGIQSKETDKEQSEIGT